MQETASQPHKAAARALFYAIAGGEFGALPDQLRATLTSAELHLLSQAIGFAIHHARAALPTDTAWRTIWEAACAEHHGAQRARGAA